MSFIVLTFIQLVDIYIWLMIVGIAMSWLIAFGVLNSDNRVIREIYSFLNRITEPVLAPIRKVIPPIGGIDISPIVILIGFQFVKQMLIGLII